MSIAVVTVFLGVFSTSGGPCVLPERFMSAQRCCCFAEGCNCDGRFLFFFLVVFDSLDILTLSPPCHRLSLERVRVDSPCDYLRTGEGQLCFLERTNVGGYR